MSLTTVSQPADLDNLQIDLAQPQDVDYWTWKLQVDRSELERAVTAAGPRIAECIGLLLAERGRS